MADTFQVLIDDVVPMDPRMEISSFAVELPSTILQGLDEPDISNSIRLGDKGMVGTIVYLKKSVMIWFGWGQLELGRRSNNAADDSTSSDSPTTTGTTTTTTITTRTVGSGK